MDQADRNLQIGLRARSLRRASGKTLQAIAESSDLSKGHLSRFERGEKTLSLAALIRLAEALNCPVAALMGETLTKSDVHLVRAANLESHTIQESEPGYSYTVLSGSEKRDDSHNTMLLSLSGGARRMSTAHHAGRELLFVVTGRVRLRLGTEDLDLEKGDYVEFSGHIPHELTSLSRRCVVLLIIISDD